MRSIVVAVSLALSLTLHAAPHLEFFAEFGTNVFLHNDSEESAHDVMVRVDWPAELRLHGSMSAVPSTWECETFDAERFGVCRIPEFAPQDFAGIFVTFQAAQSVGGHFTATATLTSRETEAQVIPFDVITSHVQRVTSGADSGPGTLRNAIEEINANPLCGTDVPCAIGFGGREEPPITIKPSTPLPAIRKCNVEIGGFEDYELPLATKRVTISGENAMWGHGLEVRASCAEGITGVQIHSLAVHSWPWNGIHFESPEPWGGRYPHGVWEVYAGTDASGLVARPNGWRGINVDSPYDRVAISGSIASGNGRSGISLWRGKQVLVNNVKLGVNRLGQPLGNGASGFASFGVPFTLAFCTIANNAHFGVAVTPGTAADIDRNIIHSNAGLPVDFGLDDRTPPDDETDGVLNAPEILDAYVDEARNATIIQGIVRLRAGAFGGSFGIYPFQALNERGEVIELLAQAQGIRAPLHDVEDVPFEFQVQLLPRGSWVSAMTKAGDGQTAFSSEISKGVQVR